MAFQDRHYRIQIQTESDEVVGFRSPPPSPKLSAHVDQSFSIPISFSNPSSPPNSQRWFSSGLSDPSNYFSTQYEGTSEYSFTLTPDTTPPESESDSGNNSDGGDDNSDDSDNYSWDGWCRTSGTSTPDFSWAQSESNHTILYPRDYPPRPHSVQSLQSDSDDELQGRRYSISTRNNEYIPVGNGYLIRRRIISNGSCLFHAVAYITQNEFGTASQLRKICSDHVREHPEDWREASRNYDHGSVEKYCQRILDPSKWGGAFELCVLSSRLGIEIQSVDIRNYNIDVYGKGKYPYRGILFYTGVHYDAVGLVRHYSDEPDEDVTQFPVDEPHYISAAVRLAMISQK
ncbi:ubiquitin-specific protease otu1 [Dispira simplex]|nr:ubiquitin-specific protease otu1 [Dispira simplex]